MSFLIIRGGIFRGGKFRTVLSVIIKGLFLKVSDWGCNISYRFYSKIDVAQIRDTHPREKHQVLNATASIHLNVVKDYMLKEDGLHIF